MAKRLLKSVLATILGFFINKGVEAATTESRVDGTITHGDNPVANMIVDYQGVKDTTSTDGKYLLRIVDNSDPVEIDETGVPIEFELGNAHPNPGNPGSRVKVEMPSNEEFTLTLYNILGQPIKSKKAKGQGSYEFYIHYGNLASGVYIYDTKSKRFRKAKKLAVLDGGSGNPDITIVGYSPNVTRRVLRKVSGKSIIIYPMPESVQESIYNPLEKEINLVPGSTVTEDLDLTSKFRGQLITGKASLYTKNKIGDNSLPNTTGLISIIDFGTGSNFGVVDNQGRFAVPLPLVIPADSAYILLTDSLKNWSNFFDKFKVGNYDFNKEPFVLELFREEVPEPDWVGNTPIMTGKTTLINSFDLLKVLTGTDPKKRPYYGPYLHRIPTLQEVIELGIPADTSYQTLPYKIARDRASDPLLAGGLSLLPDSIADFTREATDEISRNTGILILEGHNKPESGLPKRNIILLYREISNIGETGTTESIIFNGRTMPVVKDITFNSKFVKEREHTMSVMTHEYYHAAGFGHTDDYNSKQFFWTLMNSRGLLDYPTASENTALIQEHKIPIYKDITKVNSDSTLLNIYKGLLGKKSFGKSARDNLNDYHENIQEAKIKNYTSLDNKEAYCRIRH